MITYNILYRLFALHIAVLYWMPSIGIAVDAWQPPKAKDVNAQVTTWLDTQNSSTTIRSQIAQIWRSLPDLPTEGELLDCIAITFARVDPRAASLVEFCSEPSKQINLPARDWLHDKATPPFPACNLRLVYGRWLVQNGFYDEARRQLASLEPNEVVAPSILLFYQAIVNHGLANKQEALETIDRLLKSSHPIPRRYVVLAKLMREDLAAMKDGSLSHIARQMRDIRRRLKSGQSGKNVLQVERNVVESLDKLIKNLEDQQTQSGGGNGNLQPSRPAQNSIPLGGKGQGAVTRKPIGSKAGWGNLPPKEREEAMQQIGRDYPAHYREIIEQYFRTLATESTQ